MEDLKHWFDTTVTNNERLQQLKEQATSTASDALEKAKTGLVVMEAATTEQVQEAKSLASKAAEEYCKYEDIFFRHLKAGVVYSVENPGYATAAAATFLLFSYRGPRRLLYRNTLGRFRSEEAEILSAEGRVKDLKTSLDIYILDNKKLQERAEAAQVEFLSGRTKLRSTGSELQRLWKNLYKTEAQALKLKEGIRELPTRESIRLRAEVASLVAEARQQKYALGRRISQITKLGVNV